MNVPAKLNLGDSFTWEDDPTEDELGNTIDSAWTLKFVFRQADKLLTVTASANAPGWRTTISKTAFSGVPMVVGTVYWSAYAESGSDRKTVGAGQLQLMPNFDTAGTFDGRTQAEKDLEAVQAAMRGIYTNGVAEYTIMGRSLRKVPLDQLIIMESRLQAQVTRERQQQDIKNGKGNPRISKVRFTR